jgi:hypothetical protein
MGTASASPVTIMLLLDLDLATKPMKVISWG